MTQEEKLEEAKRLYKTANQDQRYVLEKLFPELAESEDEKIRNWLIGYFHQYKEDGMEKYANGLKVESIIAWLEKQYEKKVSYTTLTETGNGGINALVTKELSTNDCDDEQKPADLEEFISELSKQFPDVSFAKLSRIAVRVAKWAKPADEEMKELLRTEYEKGRADAIAERQKSTWSEDDERICNNIIYDIANDKSICKYEISKRICDEQIKWLKSLKDRL